MMNKEMAKVPSKDNSPEATMFQFIKEYTEAWTETDQVLNKLLEAVVRLGGDFEIRNNPSTTQDETEPTNHYMALYRGLYYHHKINNELRQVAARFDELI